MQKKKAGFPAVFPIAIRKRDLFHFNRRAVPFPYAYASLIFFGLSLFYFIFRFLSNNNF